MGLIVALRTLRRGDRFNSPNKRLTVAEEHHSSRIQAEKDLSEGQELRRTRGGPSRCLRLHYRRPDLLRGDWLRVCSHRGYFCPGDDVLRAQQENHKTSRSPSVSIWIVLGSWKFYFKNLHLFWKFIFISPIIYIYEFQGIQGSQLSMQHGKRRRSGTCTNLFIAGNTATCVRCLRIVL